MALGEAGERAAELRREHPVAPETYPGAAYGFFVVFMLALSYIFAFVDRASLSLVIDPIRHDLGLNDTEVSTLAGLAFVICFCIFSFPFGRWIDRGTRRNAVVLGVALWSVATVACGFAAGFWQLFAGRMAVGVGEASVNPAAYSMIPDCFPPEKRGFPLAIYATGAPIGAGLAVYLGSLLLKWAMTAHPALPLVGVLAPWKILFIGIGAPGLLVALLFLVLVREPARREAGTGESVSLKEVFGYVLTHFRLFALTFVGFGGFAISNYAFVVWGPVYFMRLHHLSVTDVGLINGLGFAVFGTLGMLAGGLWSDQVTKSGRPESPVSVCRIVAALQLPFFVAAYLLSSTTAAVILYCAGMFTASMVGGLQGSMVQALTPNRMRGQMGALFLTTVNTLGLGVAPLLTASMTDYVFGGPQGVGKSLAVTTFVSLSISVALLTLALPAARERARAILK
jgi:MFS family permease